MMVKLFIYAISLISILISVKFFEIRYQEKLIEKFHLYFPLSEIKKGNEVRDYLTLQMSNRGIQLKITDYKFYTKLANDVAFAAQKFGIPQTSFLKSLRAGLIQDLKFERKITQELKAGFFQCFFILFITWLFIIFSLYILEGQLSLRIGGSIIFLQVSGFFVFSWIFRRVKQKIFKEYGEFFSVLFRLRGYLMVGYPLGQALSESGQTSLRLKSQKFFPLQKQLEDSLVKLQTKGSGIQEDLDHIIDELWFLSELDFEQFMKQLFALKLVIILLFYFSSYFLYLVSLLSTFVLI